MRILVASSNPKKLEWFKFSLGDLGMDILSLKDAGYSLKCEEDGDSFKTNSVIKAIEALLAFEPNEFIVVSDDGGININSYHNYGLGIYTARTGKTPYELAYSILMEYMEVTGLIPLQTSIRRWIKYDILPSLK